MSKPAAPAPEQDELSAGAPIILAGAPRALRGSVQLRNPGAGRMVVREAWFHSGAVGTRAVDSPPARIAASLTATLEPGEEQPVALRLNIGRHTPPGEYRGELEVAGQRQPVLLQVTEVVRLDITPRQVVVDQVGDEAVVKRIVLTNEGNVPLTIGPIGRVPLAEELLLRRGVRGTLAASGNVGRVLADVFAEFIQDEATALVREVGAIEVQHKGGAVVLQPGESRALDLQVRLPDQLERNARYLARVPLYTATLEFVVVRTGDPPTKAEPRSRPKKGPKQT